MECGDCGGYTTASVRRLRNHSLDRPFIFTPKLSRSPSLSRSLCALPCSLEDHGAHHELYASRRSRRGAACLKTQANTRPARGRRRRRPGKPLRGDHEVLSPPGAAASLGTTQRQCSTEHTFMKIHFTNTPARSGFKSWT